MKDSYDIQFPGERERKKKTTTNNNVILSAKSGDSDQTPRSLASDLGLHYLPISLLGVSSLQWVKFIIIFFSFYLIDIHLNREKSNALRNSCFYNRTILITTGAVSRNSLWTLFLKYNSKMHMPCSACPCEKKGFFNKKKMFYFLTVKRTQFGEVRPIREKWLALYVTRKCFDQTAHLSYLIWCFLVHFILYSFKLSGSRQ